MMPTIPIGSVVVTKSVEASAIKVGDIITFKTGTEADKVVTHRVVVVSNDNGALSFRTAGDANANPDANAVLAENVVERVWFHVPFLGYLSFFVTTKLGFILLIVLPGIFIISLEIRDIVAELKLMRKTAYTGNRSIVCEVTTTVEDATTRLDTVSDSRASRNELTNGNCGRQNGR